MSDHWIETSKLALQARRVTRDPLSSTWDDTENGTISTALADHIAAILVDEAALKTVRGRSYVHPLGYVKLILWQDDEQRRLRLHLWSASQGDTVDIHDHFWDFRSVILTGRIRFTEYEVKDGDGFEASTMVPIGNGSFTTRSLGSRDLIETHREIHSHGETYALDATTPHSTFALSASMSLVFQGAAHSKSNVIYRQAGRAPVGNFQSETLALADLGVLLKDVIQTLRDDR